MSYTPKSIIYGEVKLSFYCKILQLVQSHNLCDGLITIYPNPSIVGEFNMTLAVLGHSVDMKFHSIKCHQIFYWSAKLCNTYIKYPCSDPISLKAIKWMVTLSIDQQASSHISRKGKNYMGIKAMSVIRYFIRVVINSEWF